MNNKLLSVKEVAEALSIAPKTVYMWRWKRRNLPFIKLGKALRISSKDLRKFIDAHRELPGKKEAYEAQLEAQVKGQAAGWGQK